MVRVISLLLCVLFVAYATSDFSEFFYCSNGLEEDPILRAVQPQFCVPAYSLDRSAEEVATNRGDRRKRSLDDVDVWTPVLRMSRGRENIKTIHLPSSFTPRLGRRRASGREMADPTQHVINLNAGTAFTPRLGRRIQNSQ